MNLPAILAAAATALPHFPKTLNEAPVILPFAEVRALLDAARSAPPPPDPPMAAAITRADLAFDLAGDGSLLATFTVEVFRPGWQIIPLLGTDLGVRRVDPPDAAVVPRDGSLCLLAPTPGRREIKVVLGAPRSFPAEFTLPPTSGARVSVSNAPTDRTPVIRFGDREVAAPMDLPPGGGPFRVDLVAPRPPAKPTRWTSADLDTLVVAQSDRLQVESRLHLRGQDGDGVSAQLTVPPLASGVRISGADLLPVGDHPSRPTPLAWATRGILERSLVVHYELPLPPTRERWTIEPPQVEADQRTARTVLVPAADATLTSPGATPASAGDLPSWMAGALAAGGPALQSAGTNPLVAESRPLPRLAPEPARVPEATFRTRAVPDGARITEAQLAVAHRGPARWRLRLPAGSHLLSCEANGHPASPLVTTDGLEILLAGEPGTPKVSRVAFSYTEQGARFAPVEGRFAADLPSFPAFIDQLAWIVTLPPAYEATAFDGNLEVGPPGRELTFEKRLVRAETPRVEIHYRKRENAL